MTLTDRNYLDDQLCCQFQRCEDIVNQIPVQASWRVNLRDLLNRVSGLDFNRHYAIPSLGS